MNANNWRTAVLVTAAITLIAAGLASLATSRFAWGAPESPKAQCEALDATTLPPAVKNTFMRAYQARTAAAIVREPQNTWSNLAFVFVGALVAAHDRRVFARLLGAALIALGLASGLYHASLVMVWRTADVATMAWVSFALCCVGYTAARPNREENPRRDLIVGLVGAALAMTAAVFRNDVRVAGVKPFDTTYMTIAGISGVLLLVVLGLVRAARAQPGRPLPIIRLTLLGAIVAGAVFCQLNDRLGRCLCAPESPVQAHAVWHGLMAAAIALAYDTFARIAGWATLRR
ncbi:MAG: ceramidase domain-containing protein [Opitutaceae bacterium]|nr:ceramidase domain-containing protein [Opitutaceae bacterium]